MSPKRANDAFASGRLRIMPSPKQGDLKLQVTPIPKPLFGINLRYVLRDSGWKAMRRSILSERGNRCETCSKIVEESSDLHAHEEWVYETTEDSGTAKIRRIAIQCRACHDCEHFLMVRMLVRQGRVPKERIQELIQHFCAVNDVGPQVFKRHVLQAKNDWERLSSLSWEVDLSPYSTKVIQVSSVRFPTHRTAE